LLSFLEYTAILKQNVNCKILDASESGEWEGLENFDFSWLQKVRSDMKSSPIYINLNPDPGQIQHTFPPVDRCCKQPPAGFTFDDIDEVCGISSDNIT
jgi:hypothetical protein